MGRTAFFVIRTVQEGSGEMHETGLYSMLASQMAEVDLAMALVDDATAETDRSATLSRIVVDNHSRSGLRHSQQVMKVYYFDSIWLIKERRLSYLAAMVYRPMAVQH